jgi:hypothetical protein
MAHRVFVLSPASCSGERARLVIRTEADFPLARRLRGTEGAPIGEVFSFLSGLYFRGKLVYARTFGVPRGVFVITPSRGLVSPEAPVTARDIRAFAAVPIDAGERRYRAPLARDVRRLARTLAADDEVVLLGSIATPKYIDVLGPVLGDRLRFPADFAGRGDMSRGGLLLRSARERRELAYAGVAAGRRHGPRPPRLVPASRAAARGEER